MGQVDYEPLPQIHIPGNMADVGSESGAPQGADGRGDKAGSTGQRKDGRAGHVDAEGRGRIACGLGLRRIEQLHVPGLDASSGASIVGREWSLTNGGAAGGDQESRTISR